MTETPNGAADSRPLSGVACRSAQLFELEDLGPSEAVERFRDLGVGKKQWLG